MRMTEGEVTEVVRIFLRYRTLFVVYLAGLAFYAFSAPLVASALMEPGQGLFEVDPAGTRWMGMGFAITAMILAGVSAVGVPRFTSPDVIATRPDMRQAAAVATLLYRALAMRVLCAEVIALFGLALFLTTGSLSTLYGFLAPALVLQLLALPRYTQWRATIESVRRQRSDWVTG
jgi:hypothetical protein